MLIILIHLNICSKCFSLVPIKVPKETCVRAVTCIVFFDSPFPELAVHSFFPAFTLKLQPSIIDESFLPGEWEFSEDSMHEIVLTLRSTEVSKLQRQHKCGKQIHFQVGFVP